MTALDQNTAVALLLEHINNLKIHMNDTESSNLPAIVKEWGAVSNLLVEVLKTNELYANYIDVTDLTADNAFIKYLEAAVAVVSHINADVIDVHSLYADTIKTKEFEAYKANINILLAEYIKATDIVADTITVNQLFGVCAQFFSLVSDSITAEDIVSFKVTSDHLTIKDAFIKDAMIDSITASKIIAGIIDTSKVQIKSKTGALIIADDTITIRDGESVRVQIGRDGDGNYNMYVCDTSGNVLWNALGLQADAIKSAIITDAMVSDTANINGTKIDIASVITEINSDSTMLNSSKISVDSDNQTLSAWFQTMNAWKSDTAEEVSTQSTQIEVLQGSIKTLLEDTRITELQGQYQSISSKYSALEQDVTGFKANVSSTYATKEALSNVDGKLAGYSTTSQMNSAISQSASAIKSEVSESYYTKTSVDDKLSGYATQSYVGSAIIQNKDAITLEVSSTYATKSDFDSLQIGGRNLALDSSKGWNTTAYNVIRGTLSENWIVGETYTVSLKGSTPHGYFGLWRDAGWNYCGDVKSIGNGIFRLTFVCKEETYTSQALNTFAIHHIGKDGATSIIDWIKIEKGSKNTDYSPAPEDVTYTKSIISTINQTAETIKISASKLELTGAVTFSTFDSATQSKINAASSDASTAKTNAASAISTADSASSNASSAVTTATTALSTANTAKLLTEVETISSNMKKFKNVCGCTYDIGNITGMLLIITPITPYRMVHLHIKGYNYVTDKETIDLEIGFYNYDGEFISTGFINKGSFPITSVSVAKVSTSDTRAVIYIGTASTVWSYPKIIVDEVITGHSTVSPDSYKDGFSATITTDKSYTTHELTISGKDTFALSVGADAAIAAWCYANNRTYINGSKIYTGTITATQIAANAVTADKISTNALKSRNYVANSTGSFLNLADGSWDSKNFKVSAAGVVSISGNLTSDNPNTLYSTEVNDGKIYNYGSKSGKKILTGTFCSTRPIAESGSNYDGFALTIGKSCDSFKLGINAEESRNSAFSSYYALNNGANPSGYTNRHIWWGKEAHCGTAQFLAAMEIKTGRDSNNKLYRGITTQNPIYIEVGGTTSNWSSETAFWTNGSITCKGAYTCLSRTSVTPDANYYGTAAMLYVDGGGNECAIYSKGCVNTDSGTCVVSPGKDIHKLRSYSSYMEIIQWSGVAYGINWWASDSKLKKDITNTNVSGIDFIKKLSHYQYNWKDVNNNEHVNVGYLANDLKVLDSNLAFEVKQGDKSEYDSILQIDSTKLVPYISKALQEVITYDDQRDRKINLLQQQVCALQFEVQQLKGGNVVC